MTVTQMHRVGRRIKSPADKLVSISIRLNPATAQAINAMGRKKSEWLRTVIISALREIVK